MSVVEPQSVPSRISVVLVGEAKGGGTNRLQCPRVDQDLRLLAMPASVPVCEDGHESPCVEGTLSSPDFAGKLFPVVPAGIPLPVGPVGPVDRYGMKSPSDLKPVGPVGPVGTLSLFTSDTAGPDGPIVTGGPVGPDGALSPFTSDTAGPDGPCWPV